MARFVSFDVQTFRFSEVIHMIDPLLYQDAVRQSISDAVTDTLKVAKQAASSSRRIPSALAIDVDSAPIPKFGIVKMAPVTNKGFRYAWALNSSKRRPFQRRQSPRKGRYWGLWFRNTGKLLKGKFRKNMKTIIDEIRRRWRTP